MAGVYVTCYPRYPYSNNYRLLNWYVPIGSVDVFRRRLPSMLSITQEKCLSPFRYGASAILIKGHPHKPSMLCHEGTYKRHSLLPH